MPTVNLRQARKHLHQWVTAAERGGTVIITRHGKPVAKLVSTEAEHQSTWSAALLRHLNEGPGEGPPSRSTAATCCPSRSRACSIEP